MIEEIKQQIKECLEKYYKETYNVDANIIVEEPKIPQWVILLFQCLL